MYFSSTFLDKVGYLNEYLQSAYEDDDLCGKASLLGVSIYEANVFVQHFQNKLGANLEPELPIRKNQFNILWQIPLVIEHENFQSYIKDNHVWKEEYREA